MLLSETQHQQALFSWAKQYPELDIMYAIPNQGARTRLNAARMKAEGMKAGIPDICLPIAKKGFHGLYIELKTDGGKLSPMQKKRLQQLEENGYKALVCYGWESAKDEILAYLK